MKEVFKSFVNISPANDYIARKQGVSLVKFR